MPECYPSAPRLRRPFLTTLYTPDSDGVLSAAVPSCCPQGTTTDAATCSVTIDHLRDRKTGPQHSLAVARCRRHGLGFTLYPPGFAPYRRQPVLKIAPDESPIATDEPGLRKDFADTIFEAAVDGADGKRWARDSHDAIHDHWWSTQGRHLHFAARLVGVAQSLADFARESIASVLSVSCLDQRERSSSKGYRAVGKAICDMLRQLRGSHASRAFALLVCGHLIGHWGEPLRWDVARSDLLRSAFCRLGTASGP